MIDRVSVDTDFSVLPRRRDAASAAAGFRQRIRGSVPQNSGRDLTLRGGPDVEQIASVGSVSDALISSNNCLGGLIAFLRCWATNQCCVPELLNAFPRTSSNLPWFGLMLWRSDRGGAGCGLGAMSIVDTDPVDFHPGFFQRRAIRKPVELNRLVH